MNASVSFGWTKFPQGENKRNFYTDITLFLDFSNVRAIFGRKSQLIHSLPVTIRQRYPSAYIVLEKESKYS